MAAKGGKRGGEVEPLSEGQQADLENGFFLSPPALFRALPWLNLVIEDAYEVGPVRVEKIGFGNVPYVVMDVVCRQKDIEGVASIVRQQAYRELAERGWQPEAVGVTANVLTWTGSRTGFCDENESSPFYGKKKYGNKHRVAFRVVDPELRLELAGGGIIRSLPDREAAGAVGERSAESRE
jgi:hypothetical protein